MQISDSKVDVLLEEHQSKIEDKEALLNDSGKFIYDISKIVQQYCDSMLGELDDLFNNLSSSVSVSFLFLNVKYEDMQLATISASYDTQGQVLRDDEDSDFNYLYDITIKFNKICDVSEVCDFIMKTSSYVSNSFYIMSKLDAKNLHKRIKEFIEHTKGDYKDDFDATKMSEFTHHDIYNKVYEIYSNAILLIQYIKNDKLYGFKKHFSEGVIAHLEGRLHGGACEYVKDVELHVDAEFKDLLNYSEIINVYANSTLDAIQQLWQQYFKKHNNNKSLCIELDVSPEMSAKIGIESMRYVIKETFEKKFSEKPLSSWCFTKDPLHMNPNEDNKAVASCVFSRVFQYVLKDRKLRTDYLEAQSFSLSDIKSIYFESRFLFVQYAHENKHIYYDKGSSEMKESAKWALAVLNECFNINNISRKCLALHTSTNKENIPTLGKNPYIQNNQALSDICVNDDHALSDQDSKSAFLEEKDEDVLASIFDDVHLSSIDPNMEGCCGK